MTQIFRNVAVNWLQLLNSLCDYVIYMNLHQKLHI